MVTSLYPLIFNSNILSSFLLSTIYLGLAEVQTNWEDQISLILEY